MARTILGVWQAEGEVVRVLDGDTLECDLDLGWNTWRRVKVRILNINAPETTTAPGIASSEHLSNLLPENSRIIVTSHELDVYGRTLGTVRFAETASPNFGADVGARMIADGFASSRDE